jgi:uncharacterized protein YPO0396
LRDSDEYSPLVFGVVVLNDRLPRLTAEHQRLIEEALPQHFFCQRQILFICRMLDRQMRFGEDTFYQKYEQKIKLLTDKFMPPRDEDEQVRAKKRQEMEQYADYRNYLSFSMFEQVTDEQGNVIRENFVDDMAGRDSGGEGQNPKYVALLAGFAMLYMQQSNRDSKIKLVLLDEAFSKMDQERSAVCLKYARKMDLQLIVCVPDERLQSLIRNVDCVYGFRRHQNQISMMHIDKGDYLKLMEGEHGQGEPETVK